MRPFLICLTLLLSGFLNANAQTFTYAAQADAVGLSPILTNDQVSATINRHIYENLVKRDAATNELVPWLAESWETSDANTWIFHLRPDVTFQDGTPFNAEAVKFTFERILDPEVASPRASLLKPIESITVIDDLTLEIKTTEPYGAFLAALAHTNAAIVSPTAVEKYGDLMKNPVGTGPFKFEEWVTGDSITLVRNDDYWQEAPKIERFVVRVIPEVNTQVALLERGEIQLMDSAPPELIARLQQNADLEVTIIPGTPVFYLGFNYQNPLWQNKTAREAVASAINGEVIVSLLSPLAEGSCDLIGPQVFGYSAAVEANCTTFDAARAAELWGQVDARPITLWVPQIGDYPRVGQIVQGQLSQAGFDVSINTVEWGAYLAATSEYQQDLFLLGWSNITADGSELLYPNLDSANIGASNRSAYNNPDADALIEASRGTTDQDERLNLLTEASTLLLKDIAWVTLYHGASYIIHPKTLTGVELLPNGDWSVAHATLE